MAISGYEGVERVCFELTRHPEWLWPRDPKASIPPGLADEIFAFSDHVVTTVWLLILWQEESVATDFVTSVNIDEVVADFESHAGSRSNARELLAEEVDGLVEKAGMFSARISNLIDNDVIVGNDRVRDYCTETLGRMLDAWLEYRAKLQAVVGPW